MKPIVFIFLLALLCAPMLAPAQDYVIKHDGDTIHGEILRFDFASVKIKPKGAKAMVFGPGPGQVAAFSKGGFLFVSREVYFTQGQLHRFLGFEVAGKVNMLIIGRSNVSAPVMMPAAGGGTMMMGGGGGGRASYYVEKAGQQPTLLYEAITPALTGEKRLEKVRAVLLNVMGDDPEIADRIQNTVYLSPKVVKEMVLEYNQKNI